MKHYINLILMLGIVLSLCITDYSMADDPCEAVGDPLDSEEDFEIPFDEGCCDGLDPEVYQFLVTVTVRLVCRGESDCAISDIKDGDEITIPSDGGDNIRTFDMQGDGPFDITVELDGDCDACCLVVEYFSGCCLIEEPEELQPGCRLNGSCPVGNLTAGMCGQPDCEECPEECEDGDDPDDVEGGDIVDPGSDDPCADPETANSVSLHRGHKRETATDLRVNLPGRDFVVTRKYSSDPKFNSNGLVGPKWTLSPLAVLIFDGPCNGSLYSGGGGICGVTGVACLHDTKIPVPGPTDHYWIKNSIEILGKLLPVWRLVAPGESEQIFVRDNETGAGENDAQTWHQVNELDAPYPRGLLIQSTDEYHNTFTYEYEAFGSTVRLVNIELQSEVDGHIADVEFDWTVHWHADSRGKVAEIRVVRDGQITQRVSYTYMDEWKPDSYSSSLGRQGDLVQVVHEMRVDESPVLWRERVTQYRYHDAPGSSAFDWAGSPHQLRLVLNSEQIEFAVSEWNTGTSLGVGAEKLLALADDELIANNFSPRVIELAAKVIEKYELAGEQRVLVQHLKSDCGCGSSAPQAKRLDYARTSWSNDLGMTTEITENVPDGEGDWMVHRTVLYDTLMLGTAPGTGERDMRVPYLISRAIHDGEGNEWVTRFDHDTNRNRIRTFTPASIDEYDPTDNDDPPAALAYEHEGLVYHYTYDANHRRNSVSISKGELVF